jgi:hypothetical protein
MNAIIDSIVRVGGSMRSYILVTINSLILISLVACGSRESVSPPKLETVQNSDKPSAETSGSSTTTCDGLSGAKYIDCVVKNSPDTAEAILTPSVTSKWNVVENKDEMTGASEVVSVYGEGDTEQTELVLRCDDKLLTFEVTIGNGDLVDQTEQQVRSTSIWNDNAPKYWEAVVFSAARIKMSENDGVANISLAESKEFSNQYIWGLQVTSENKALINLSTFMLEVTLNNGQKRLIKGDAVVGDWFEKFCTTPKSGLP